MGAIDYPDAYPNRFGSPPDLEVSLVVMLFVEPRLALKLLRRSICSPQDTREAFPTGDNDHSHIRLDLLCLH
jgi:hypothetical protein